MGPSVQSALLEHKFLIERSFKEAQGDLSSFSFVALFAWKEHFQFHIETIDNCLCIFAEDALGTFLSVPPLGKKVDKKTIEACFSKMEKANGAGSVSRIENVPFKQTQAFDPQRYELYLKSYEPCYYREDIVGLKGNAYKSKRSSYNAFVKNNTQEYLPYESAMMESCLCLYDDWAKERESKEKDDVYLSMLKENRDVHRLLLESSEELGLIGRVVVIKGKVRAYTFGYPLNEKTFCILLEVADLHYKGLPVFIFREFCKDDAAKKFPFINGMDSFGMKNVEVTKDSFRPQIRSCRPISFFD